MHSSTKKKTQMLASTLLNILALLYKGDRCQHLGYPVPGNKLQLLNLVPILVFKPLLYVFIFLLMFFLFIFCIILITSTYCLYKFFWTLIIQTEKCACFSVLTQHKPLLWALFNLKLLKIKTKLFVCYEFFKDFSENWYE